PSRRSPAFRHCAYDYPYAQCLTDLPAKSQAVRAGRVPRTGRPERFEIAFQPMGRWLNVSVCRPGPDHFVAIFDDITERKQAEDAVLTSEKRLTGRG
ncbi:hypothetical protein, partial [Rhodoblastus sphagnicola]|uniref:hypothetical protein n=1 Tax=Rhodoblastus sphagnicola TaxID=333368 RepID=UPI0019D49E46